MKKFEYQTTHLLLHTNCFGDLDPHPILVFPPLNDDLHAFLVRPNDLGGWQYTLDAIVLFRSISPSEVSPPTHVRSKKHSLLLPHNAQSPDKPKKRLNKQNPKEKKHTETSRRSTAISLITEAANNRRQKSTRMRRSRRERETQQRQKKQYPETPICMLPRSGGNPNPGHPLLQRSNDIARMGPYA